jgi:hypothetical protein
VSRIADAGAQPDWLADAVNFGFHVARRLGRHGDRVRAAVNWMDTRVTSRVRRHPIAAAALLAAVLALPYAASKLVFEGYPAALVLFSFALPAASLFAFIVVVGRYLRAVEPRQGGPRPGLSSAVMACTVGTVVFAFHDSLLAHQTPATVNALFFGAGVAAGAVSFATQVALRRFRAHKALG